MQRGELADLAAFVVVADHLSFRGAATRLGVTPSAVSHTMRQLEERLGLRLLHRTTRSVSLTDAGMRLVERLRPALSEITDALEGLDEERERPFGRLRLYATHVAASAVIAPIWEQFLSAYPDVQLEVQIGEAPIDIVARGFDAGVGPQSRVDAGMTAVRVMGPIRIAVVGAPSYFAGRRPPRAPEDLVQHCCVRYRRDADGQIAEWPFQRDGAARQIAIDGRITVNNPDLGLRAAVDGLGIVYTIEALAEPFLRSGQLVRVLEEWSPAFEGLFLYYSGRRQLPAALRGFIDMIQTARSSALMVSTLEEPLLPKENRNPTTADVATPIGLANERPTPS